MKSDISKVTRITESVGFPETVLIDNFSGCNLSCSCCDHKNIRKYRKVLRMKWGLYTKLIDEIALENPEARVWEIFFGDPFLCGDMPKRIKYAKDKGLKNILLNTNGVLMTHDRAKAVIEAGLDEIHVGIDAFKPETYDEIRIGGDYQKVVENTLNYRDILRNIGKSSQKLYVQLVVMDNNEDEVEDFKKFWHSRGIGVKIRPKVSWGGIIDASNLSTNDEKRKPCYWLMRTINICADGLVALCSIDGHCLVNCGDTQKTSIKEVWNGQLAEYRAMHKEHRFSELPALCRDCRDWQSAYSETIG